MRPKSPSGIDWSEGVPLGRYVVYDRLASGGTAAVHIGKFAGVGGFSRVVAIKKLHEHVAGELKFVAMLLDEARLVSGLRHPNIVPTLDIIEDGDSIALVMEYVHGLPLSHAMRIVRERNETVPLSIVLSVVVDILHGLGAAHSAVDADGVSMKIVHRDVSPQNVLVGTDGRARIVDFGIAHAAQRLQSTQAGELKGKVAYMAPEQLTGDEIDCRSDLFAVGVMLWELLTSRRLFYAKTEGHTVANVLNLAIEPPLPAGQFSALNEVVLRSLARDLEARYSSCEEMAEALEATMPLAKPREVANWLAQVDAEHLAALKELMRRIDASAVDGPKPSPRISQLLAAVSAPVSPEPKSARRPAPAPAPAVGRRPAPEPAPAPAGPFADRRSPGRASLEPAAVSPTRAPSLGAFQAPTGQIIAGMERPKPTIRKIRTSSDSAITNVRIGSAKEIDEIRRPYERGDIAEALHRAEAVRMEEGLTRSSIPRVNVTKRELLKLPLDHRAGFMLTLVDGHTNVEALLSVAAMPEAEALAVLGKLVTIGALSVFEGPQDPENPDDATLRPERQ